MEVVADRAGGESVIPASPDETASRVRLNIALYAATVVLACAAIFLGFVIQRSDLDLAFWKNDKADSAAPGAGEDLGRGVVTAIARADRKDQERVGEQIAAAQRMAVAMTNLDYQDADTAIAAVQAEATGDFREQYGKAAADLKKLAAEAKSTMHGEVVWAGLVSGDEDSATVIVATRGTVANKQTDQQQRTNNYRIQVELVLENGHWLTRDLQFVA